MKKLLLFIVLFTTFSTYSQTLDPTFGNNGVVTNIFSNGPSTDTCGDAALQTDGKIIFVGRNNLNTSSFIARTNISGSLDSTFNSSGYITFNANGFDTLLIQPDEKIIVLGQNKIYRLNNNGTLDTSFNNTGFLNLNTNSFSFYGKSIAFQNDGKIILAGTANNGANNDYVIIRLNSDGSFDSTFDFDGKAIIALGNGADEAFSVAIQADGKIVVTGQTYNGTDYDFGTIRLNANGAIDTSFATNGISILQFGAQDFGKSVDIQTDGKILIAGIANTKLAVVRYLSNGTLDSSFDNDGKLITTTGFTNSTTITSINLNKPKIKYLTTTGKILVSGQSTSNFCLIQLNSNGSFDTTFGGNNTGINTNNVGSLDASCFLLIKPDGKILTGGSSYSSMFDSVVSKSQFSSNGIFENSFTLNLSYGSDLISKTIEQSSGKTVSLINNSSLKRYNTDGTIDTTFGSLGSVDLSVNNGYDMKQQNDKIILSSFNSPKLIRLTSDGILDNTFGINGILDFSLNTNNTVAFIDVIKPLSNGKILIGFDYDELAGGNSINNFSYGLLLLNTDGTLDTTFGINGITKTRFDYYGASSNEFPQKIIVQSNNKIIVVGFFNAIGSGDRAIGLARFNSNGTIDTTFGTYGKVVTYNGYNNFPLNLAVLSDDKLLLNSSIYDLNNNKYITSTIKYDSNGFLDNTFGTNGILTDFIYSNDMIVQSDGKIIKAGNLNSHFAITRFNSDSTLDTTFGNFGILSTPIFYFSDISSILLLQNNKILAGGFSYNGSNKVATQARFTNTSLGTLDFVSNKNSILIYPNPIQSDATFTYNLVNDETVSIDVIDLQGKIVQSVLQNKFQAAGSHNQTINLSNTIAAGNYILKFSSFKGNQSIKIIKRD